MPQTRAAHARRLIPKAARRAQKRYLRTVGHNARIGQRALRSNARPLFQKAVRMQPRLFAAKRALVRSGSPYLTRRTMINDEGMRRRRPFVRPKLHPARLTHLRRYPKR